MMTCLFCVIEVLICWNFGCRIPIVRFGDCIMSRCLSWLCDVMLCCECYPVALVAACCLLCCVAIMSAVVTCYAARCA